MPNSFTPKETITYEDFSQLDLRVGKVVKATAPEWSEKLLQFSVDFGPEIGQKNILSGVKDYYRPEDFEGNSYLFVLNLAERKMGPSVSQGMMLFVDEPPQAVKFELPAEVEPGSVVR